MVGYIASPEQTVSLVKRLEFEAQIEESIRENEELEARLQANCNSVSAVMLANGNNQCRSHREAVKQTERY